MQDITLDGTRITFVQGTLEHSSSSVRVGTEVGVERYTQIRFSGGRRLDDVYVDDMLTPFVQGGDTGTWCFAMVGGRPALVGFRDGAGRFHDANPRNYAVHRAGLVFNGWLMVIVGIPLAFFVVGFILVALGVLSLVKAARDKRMADVAYDLAADPSVVPTAPSAPVPLAVAA